MCDSPLMIPNPFKGLVNVGLNRFKDCTSAFLPVPCGNCPTCIALRQSYFVSRCQMESLNNHLFMITLTYKNSMIRSVEVNGRNLYYPDFSDVQKMFKRLRKNGLKFKYLFVSEYGGKRHRPHFHGIISVPKKSTDTFLDIMNLEHKLSNLFLSEWRRNIGSNRNPTYVPLCEYVSNFKGRTYDFHYINSASTVQGESDVAFYVTKYILKSDQWLDRLKSALKLNLSPDDFNDVWSLLKPRCNISKGFGLGDNVKSHIRQGIDLAISSNNPFPYFINTVSGKTFPLSPYYRKRYITYDDALKFYNMRDSNTKDDIKDSIDDVKKNWQFSNERFSKVCLDVNLKNQSYDFMYDNEDFENVSFIPAEELEEIGTNHGIGDFNFSEFSEDF